MTELRDDERHQADLLDAFRVALAGDGDAAPPAELDPGLADVAWCLVRDLSGPGPRAAHVERLRRRLTVEAAGIHAQRNGARAPSDASASPRDPNRASRHRLTSGKERPMAATVHETIRELTSSTLATLDTLVALADAELAEPSSHVCAQGKDVWTLITNDIDHEKIHVGQIFEARYEARITHSHMHRLIAEWLMERARLIGALVGLSDAQLNQETAPGGWTYHAVAKHTLLVEQDSLKNICDAIACREAPAQSTAEQRP